MAKAIEAGIPKLRIEEAAARTQARIDSGQQPVIGVNKFRLDINEQVDVLKIDNSAVRAGQIAKLERLRAERDQGACDSALEALTNAAGSGEGNLLDLAVQAARAKASVGERLEILAPVDNGGKFTAAVPEFVGQHVFKANPKIVERLKENGRLLGLTGEALENKINSLLLLQGRIKLMLLPAD